MRLMCRVVILIVFGFVRVRILIGVFRRSISGVGM